jgi:hypothetical protein
MPITNEVRLEVPQHRASRATAPPATIRDPRQLDESERAAIDTLIAAGLVVPGSGAPIRVDSGGSQRDAGHTVPGSIGSTSRNGPAVAA